jgi:uncharacterized protein
MSLLLDISGLEREVGQCLAFQLTGSPPESIDLPEDVVWGPVSLSGRAIWTGDAVLVEGRVTAGTSFTCSRCLKVFEARIEAAVSCEFKATDEDQSGGERLRGRRGGRVTPHRDESRTETLKRRGDAQPGAEAEELPLPFSNQQLDLAFPAKEALVLELPMKPVCRDDCAGLCPVCGNDLNGIACGCRAEKADNRFLTLKKLLEAEERRE